MSRQRHWLFWVNCMAELVLVFILVFDKSQLANGFGPGPNGGARVSKKVKLFYALSSLYIKLNKTLVSKYFILFFKVFDGWVCAQFRAKLRRRV